MALMVALGLMTGLQREIRSKILGATAHVSIFRSGSEPFENYREVVEAVRSVPGVLGSAPAVYGKGLSRAPAGSRRWPRSRASCPAQERTVTDLARAGRGRERWPRSTPAERRRCRPILLGRDLARQPGRGRGRRGHA